MCTVHAVKLRTDEIMWQKAHKKFDFKITNKWISTIKPQNMTLIFKILGNLLYHSKYERTEIFLNFINFFKYLHIKMSKVKNYFFRIS